MTYASGTQTNHFQPQMAISSDGACISYRTIGTGPALIIIPGAMSKAKDYRLLATTLADMFTVHIIERRGRGLSSALGLDYSIVKECEDIAAVQQQTQAHFLFGHSYGGLIAFEAARKNPLLHKIAVYEPGISINQSISTAWLPAYQAHLAADDPLRAFIDFIRGSGPALMQWIPDWWLRFVLPKVIHGDEWAELVALLPSNFREHQEVARLNDTYQNYREVTTGVLLMSGGKSPAFREQTLHALASILAESKIEILPKRDHFAPTRGAPSEVAEVLKAYFLS